MARTQSTSMLWGTRVEPLVPLGLNNSVFDMSRSKNGGEMPELLAPGWVRCIRCDVPQPILAPTACTGASASNGAYFCNNGRDCSLRLRRKLRNR